MAELSLRKQVEEWITAYQDIVERNALAEEPDESAGYLLSLIRTEIEKRKVTLDKDEDPELYTFNEGANCQLDAVLKCLE